MHFGLADPYDCPKCGQLECVIFVSGGLRSRYPLINIKEFFCISDADEPNWTMKLNFEASPCLRLSLIQIQIFHIEVAEAAR